MRITLIYKRILGGGGEAFTIFCGAEFSAPDTQGFIGADPQYNFQDLGLI